MGVAPQVTASPFVGRLVRIEGTREDPDAPSFSNFAAVPSNVVAFETARLFADGVQPFVALFGPSGWGKTHLLKSACARLRDHLGCAVEPEDAANWIVGGRARPADVAVLDNVQDAIERPRLRAPLRIALERRVRAGRPTILAFTADRSTKAARESVPQWREWIIATLKTPGPAERVSIVGQTAASQDLWIAESLREILAKHLEGNGRTLIGALKRLRMLDRNWLDSPAVLRACGVLNPFFSCNANWDLREHLYEVANVLSSEELAGFRASELAVHAMLRVALLSEADVARFFKAQPAKVYIQAAEIESRIRSSEAASEASRRYIERAVLALQSS